MANRMSSSGWSQKNATKYRSNKSRSSKRQLGSTSIEWITPLHAYKPRVTVTPVIPKAVCGHDSGRKTLAKSSRPNSGQSKLQGTLSVSNHSLTTSTSQTGLGALPKPLKPASRPSSSQKPHNRWSVTPSSSVNGITPPQGFDLASYIKKNGTTQGIIIGRNGQPTSDDYFDAYLMQCEEEVANEQPEDLLDCEASSVDLSEESDLNDSAVNDRSVPLCWNEQLALSKCLRSVTPNISEKSTASEMKLKDNLRVKLMLNEQCLLERSWVKALQELPAPLLKTKAITSGNERGQSTHQQNHVLEILLYSPTHKAQQQLLNQSFSVCVVVHSTESVRCMFEELAARRVLSCVSVITVHLSESEQQRCPLFRTEAVQSCSSNLNNVTVWYQQQRLLLFSAQLQPTGESLQAVASAQQSEGFVDKVQQQLAKTRENERPPYLGPPDVPEKLFHKRIRYCNQDEDEDRTDIAVISSYLPELRLMEGEGSQHISPSPPKQSTIQREVSAKTTTTHIPNTLSYSSSSNKQAPKIIIIPSVSENISRHHRPLKKSLSDLLSEEKKNHRKTDRGSNAFSIIANNWIGHYF